MLQWKCFDCIRNGNSIWYFNKIEYRDSKSRWLRAKSNLTITIYYYIVVFCEDLPFFFKSLLFEWIEFECSRSPFVVAVCWVGRSNLIQLKIRMNFILLFVCFGMRQIVVEVARFWTILPSNFLLQHHWFQHTIERFVAFCFLLLLLRLPTNE